MIIELEMLQAKLAPGFPPEMKMLLEHMIISHHGQYEFGSPKLPMFPEAVMLHYLDDLDSKMESMRAMLEREGDQESMWTSYNSNLGRPLLNSARFLQKPITAAATVEEVVEEEVVATVELTPDNHTSSVIETKLESDPSPKLPGFDLAETK